MTQRRTVALLGRGNQDGQTLPDSCSCQDPSAKMEVLLHKHQRLEQRLEAQVEKLSTLEATARSLQQGRHAEAQNALARCQALLLRYLWL